MQSLFAISGRRRLELFGEDHNIRPGWVTVGTHLTSSNFNPQVGYPTWSLLTRVEHTEQNRTEQNRTEQNRTEQKKMEKKEKKRLDKKEKKEKKKPEKTRKDYTFWRHFNEKPSIIPGCPGHKHTHKPPHCYTPH